MLRRISGASSRRVSRRVLLATVLLAVALSFKAAKVRYIFVTALAVGVLMLEAWGQVTVDFESLPDGRTPNPGDLFTAIRDLGVTFENPVEVVRCDSNPAVRSGACSLAKSGRYAVRTRFHGEFARHIVNIRFSAGQDSVTLFVRYDSDLAGDNGQEVVVVLQAYDTNGNSLGSQTVRFTHNFPSSEWQEVTFIPVAFPPGRPAPQIGRIELWGGLTIDVGSPPERSRATNFLVIDDLRFTRAAPPPSADTQPPRVTIVSPAEGARFTDVGGVDVEILVAENEGLATVDMQVVHESGRVIMDFTGGNICGGRGSFPGRERCERSYEGVPLVVRAPVGRDAGRYTISFRACDLAGNCSGVVSRSVVLEITPPRLVRSRGYVEVNQGVALIRPFESPIVGAAGGGEPFSGGTLVAGKDTVVRWYLAGESGPVPNFSATMLVTIQNRDGSERSFRISPNTSSGPANVPAPASDGLPPVEAMRSDLSQTLNFVIPGSELRNASRLILKLEKPLSFTVGGGTRAVEYHLVQRELGLGIVLPRGGGTGSGVTCDDAARLIGPYLKRAFPISILRIFGCRRMGVTAGALSNGALLWEVFVRFGGDAAPGGADFVVTLAVVSRMPGGGGGIAFRPCYVRDIPFSGITTYWSDYRTAVTTPFGDTAAQEIAHTLGLVHLSNAHGESGGGMYERDPNHGAIDTVGAIAEATTAPSPDHPFGQWNLILIPLGDPSGNHTHDFMSYGSSSLDLGSFTSDGFPEDRWVSNRTYYRIWETLESGERHQYSCLGTVASDRRSRSAISSSARLSNLNSLNAPAQQPEERVEALLIHGSVQEDGSIVLAPLLRKPVPKPMIDFAGNMRPEVGPFIELFDANGKTLLVHPVLLLGGEMSDDPHHRSLNIVLPFVEGIARVVIKEGETVLADKRASLNPPQVRVTYPNGGEILPSGEVTVRWEASDPDGDPLTFLVQYSPDNGQSWQGVGLVQGPPFEATVEINELIPGQKAFIRVTASDGIHTSTDLSDGFFSLGTQSPPEPGGPTGGVTPPPSPPPAPPPAGGFIACAAGADGAIDDLEMLSIIDAWIKQQSYQNCGVPSDLDIMETLDRWIKGGKSAAAFAPLQIRTIALSQNPVRTSAARFAVEGSGIAQTSVQVFALNGRLVFAKSELGRTVSFDRVRELPNGVYLYMVHVRGYDGGEYVSEMRKLVILR